MPRQPLPRLANPLIALCGLAVFLALASSSGRIAVGGGLGWDGQGYALMLKGALSDGSPNMVLRPLVVLAARIPYAVGAGIVGSFQIVDAVSASVLYLVVAALLERRGLTVAARTWVTVNLALCIATSKMFGFYPVLVDLGALAVISAAFYFVATDRIALAVVACLLAPMSREFGIAPALYAVHRNVRLRRGWTHVVAYVPALLVPALLRLPALGLVKAGARPLSISDALANLRLWEGLTFPLAFGYFSLTLFGGLTVLAVVCFPRCIASLRAEPELVTFALPIVGAAAVGNADIWRYLVFCLPVLVILVAECLRGATNAAVRRVLIAATLVTVLTQRPLEAMNTERYFADWFPVYLAVGGGLTAELIRVWMLRLMSATLATAALYAIARRNLASTLSVVTSGAVRTPADRVDAQLN